MKTKKITLTVSFYSLLILVIIAIFFYLNQVKKLTQKGVSEEKSIEITYKATSPKGVRGGIALPASCDSQTNENYDHSTGAPYPSPGGRDTNRAEASRFFPSETFVLRDVRRCATNNNSQSIFLNADHQNFINNAPGVIVR